MTELKAPESDACYDPEPEPKNGDEKWNQIIDADPSSIFAITKLQREDLEDPKEGERLFHSQMWVKGSPMQFLVDGGSQ